MLKKLCCLVVLKCVVLATEEWYFMAVSHLGGTCFFAWNSQEGFRSTQVTKIPLQRGPAPDPVPDRMVIGNTM